MKSMEERTLSILTYWKRWNKRPFLSRFKQFTDFISFFPLFFYFVRQMQTNKFSC
ncbi:hypothetical protein IC582_024091 [Cucumis melo]